MKTQLPYALLVAVLGMIVGDLGTAMGLPVWVALLLGVGILVAFLRLLGRSVVVRDTDLDTYPPTAR